MSIPAEENDVKQAVMFGKMYQSSLLRKKELPIMQDDFIISEQKSRRI